MEGEVLRLTVVRADDDHLGFSVRGGSEHGLCVFISRVEKNSAADVAGLCVGDKLLEVNGVSLENVTMSRAVQVMTGHARLGLVVQRVGHVPGVRFTNEKTTWVDLIHRRMVVEESDAPLSVYSSDGALCRTVHLYLSHHQPCLGLNIRGGQEYNLGIYVSKLDPGGLAEQGGVKMGDQILSANGVNFEKIRHYRAVEVLKRQSHVILTIKEAGRYPAYKEMVAEFSWMNKSGSGVSSSSQGSDSHSSASSLSSGTPLGSVSGFSQTTLPVTLPLGSKMADVCSSTGAQFHTDPTDDDCQTEQLCTVSRGPTELLQDSVIRSEGEEESGEDRQEKRKISLLMALSRPGPPVHRTQSHMTMSEQEKKQKIKQNDREEERGSPLQRSKTFFGLFRKRDSSRSRSRSASRSESILGRDDEDVDDDVLSQVRDMAVRLLEEEDVTVLMDICQRYLTERDLQTLVHPLLAILDTPESLLLLREIRTLVSSDDLPLFNRMMTPFEEEAYDILKRRSRRTSPLRSSQTSHAPELHLIPPAPARGSFELHDVENVKRESHLAEGLEQLCVSRDEEQNNSLQTSVSFRSLLDIPVDSLSHTDSLRSSRASPLLPNWLLAENTDSSHRSEHALDQSDGTSLHSQDTVTQRGRLPFRNGHSKSKKQREEREGSDVIFTVVDMPRHKRPLLSQVFGIIKKSHDSTVTPAGWSEQQQHHEHPVKSDADLQHEQEHELTTVNISKTKQSLGISISGGAESRVQPMVRIERIFPGGAASANDALRAGFELVSVDGVSLQGVTHQDAVEIIRQAFSNKSINPMVLVVKIPKDSDRVTQR